LSAPNLLIGRAEEKGWVDKITTPLSALNLLIGRAQEKGWVEEIHQVVGRGVRVAQDHGSHQ